MRALLIVLSGIAAALIQALYLNRSHHGVLPFCSFDIDCTVACNDQLDLLADFMGVGEAVAAITNSAMDGSMSLEQALERRLEVIACTPADIQAFLAAHPPASRLTPVRAGGAGGGGGGRTAWGLQARLRATLPACRARKRLRRDGGLPAPPAAALVQGARELIGALQSRGVAVYLIRRAGRRLVQAGAAGPPPLLAWLAMPPCTQNAVFSHPAPQRRLPRAVLADCAGAGGAAVQPVCQPHELAG